MEKLAAFRGDVRIPLEAVDRIGVQQHPWAALRGFRAPGTGVPGVLAYGTRLCTGAAPDFAALHGRGPAVCVELSAGAPFARLLVTVSDPDRAVGLVRRRLGSTPDR